MEEPPNHDYPRYDQQTEHLIAPVEPPLLGAPGIFGDLLEVRFDAAFDHAFSVREFPDA